MRPVITADVANIILAFSIFVLTVVMVVIMLLEIKK